MSLTHWWESGYRSSAAARHSKSTGTYYFYFSFFFIFSKKFLKMFKVEFGQKIFVYDGLMSSEKKKKKAWMECVETSEPQQGVGRGLEGWNDILHINTYYWFICVFVFSCPTLWLSPFCIYKCPDWELQPVKMLFMYSLIFLCLSSVIHFPLQP